MPAKVEADAGGRPITHALTVTFVARRHPLLAACEEGASGAIRRQLAQIRHEGVHVDQGCQVIDVEALGDVNKIVDAMEEDVVVVMIRAVIVARVVEECNERSTSLCKRVFEPRKLNSTKEAQPTCPLFLSGMTVAIRRMARMRA
ncbi:MAG TPA: hypothetical protein VNO55_13815 [Polyangia bacterium]|nr:hypothetical protein [Polyangia bacterium]